MNKIIKKFLADALGFFLSPLKYVVPKGNIIILGTYSPFIYCENTKYLYEYLSRSTNYKVYWVTESEQIKHYLDTNNLLYVTNKRVLHKIMVCLRARVVIDSGTGYHNFLNLCEYGTVKISTMHGNGPKNILTTCYGDMEIIAFNKFNFVNYGASFACREIGEKNNKLPKEKVLCFGFPRTDQFFDTVKVNHCFNRREMTKKIIPHYQDGEKTILYTPTWRPYNCEFPLSNMEGFSLIKFDDFLKSKGIYFLFTLHSMLSVRVFPQNLERVKFINHQDDPFFDVQNFMMEVDVLLNDYSNTSTDFSLLRKPQIFFMPDYNKYLKEKGFAEDYRSVMPGKEVFDFEDFKQTILFCMSSPHLYLESYEKQRNLLLDHYYDRSLTNSCELYTDFIKKLMI